MGRDFFYKGIFFKGKKRDFSGKTLEVGKRIQAGAPGFVWEPGMLLMIKKLIKLIIMKGFKLIKNKLN